MGRSRLAVEHKNRTSKSKGKKEKKEKNEKKEKKEKDSKKVLETAVVVGSGEWAEGGDRSEEVV